MKTKCVHGERQISCSPCLKEFIAKRTERANKESNAIREVLDRHGIQYPRCGFHIGMGWLPIVDECLGKMIEAGWNKELDQVKEKFCGLRIYINEATKKVHDLITEAKIVCDKLCENCGKPHDLVVPRSGMALCEICQKGDLI